MGLIITIKKGGEIMSALKSNEQVNTRHQTEAEFLAWYQEEEKNRYEKPSVTVDMLIFTVTNREIKNNRKLPQKDLRILLVKRRDHPYMGKWAIPGGFVNIKEGLQATAIRELKEETNLDNIYMEQLYTWGDDVVRDPRMRVISTSYMALVDSTNLKVQAGDDAEDAKWFSIQKNVISQTTEHRDERIIVHREIELILQSEDKEDGFSIPLIEETVIDGAISQTKITVMATATSYLAFDHAIILNYGLDRLRNKMEYTAIAFHLMPKYFSLTELQMVYETILGKRLLKPNFRRKIMPMVVETEKEETDKAHRPSKLYTFNMDWMLHQFSFRKEEEVDPSWK